MNCEAIKRHEMRLSKPLKRLLRALMRDKAELICERDEIGEISVFGVYGDEQGRRRLMLRPGRRVAEYCIKQDLLTKNDAGWAIGTNGRYALKRLLSDVEPFAEQHQQRKIRSRNINHVDQNVMVNDSSSPLGWLARRKDTSGQPMISKTQLAAGERLAQDFQYAGLMQRITSSWSGNERTGKGASNAGAGVLMSDNRLDARQRVRDAMDQMGHDLANILLDICCFQLGLSEAEKARGWPRRSGKIILRIALDQLADHYGMTPIKQYRDTSSSISHWGSKDYKPL